ncbi:caffeic acid 3-O-methyltransferase-like [Senna tora]|uniref:Caffeic acid 3-O-methyltransferase-like n=1 Tax=Senna tora TaxID=362788 RepID=A0A835CLV1_9FABA|nr:caffeic acid 3-O-methyltransferase-like [Senna tora]
MALQTTIELGVFDVIAKAGEGAKLSANDIADQLPTKNPDAPKMLDRLLGLLATHSILHCSSAQTHTDDDDASTVSQRLYSLAPASKFFARDADAMSLGPILTLIQHKVFLESWDHLKDTIMEGGSPFEKAHGVHQFEYLGLDSEFNKIFNISLTQHTSIVMKKILESYKGFENLNTLVDVGGGLGFNLSMITSKYPHIKAINFDLSHVIQQAPPYLGVEHVAGDMFESVPKADAIFMKVIAVESGITAMLDTTASTKCNFEVDVFMMAQDPGGKERNQHEFLQLAKAAGFKEDTTIEHHRKHAIRTIVKYTQGNVYKFGSTWYGFSGFAIDQIELSDMEYGGKACVGSLDFIDRSLPPPLIVLGLDKLSPIRLWSRTSRVWKRPMRMWQFAEANV